MPSFVFLAPAISLGICLMPVLLLRRGAYARAQDYFVSSGPTPPGVIQNSSIAHVLRLGIFGPLFAWGASGDLWPAIIGAVFLGLGLYLIYMLRRPMLGFLGEALSSDRSITINEFIARRHGDDPAVRLLAAGLTVFALTGLIVCEAIGLATMLKPILSEAAGSSFLYVCVILILMVLVTVLSGNSGVMYSAQMQLGALYFGLFGATVLLLYLQISALKAIPPPATLGIVFVTAFCAFIIFFRHSRYVDNNLIMEPGSGAADAARARPGARPLRVFQRILNVCISVLAVLVVVIFIMELSAEGFSAIARDSTAALLVAPQVPSLGLAALVLFPLSYQIVDMTNWQRIAAFEKDRDASGGETSQWSAAFRKFCVTYAAESPLAWLFLCAFGAIAAASMATPDGVDVMQDFIRQLISQDNTVAMTALSLLLVSVLAMALSAMSSLFSASLCVFRYDILPVPRPEPASMQAQAAGEAKAVRRTLATGGGLCLVILPAYYLLGEYLGITLTSRAFLALVLGFSCAQLAFLPLALGPLIGRASEGYGTVGPKWALGILSVGAAAGVGAVAVYFTTGHEPWLWAAVPACLGTGLVLFTIARLRTAKAA